MSLTSSRRRQEPGLPAGPDTAAELAELRADLAELREMIRALAGLAFGIGVTRAPVGTNGSLRNVADVCRMYGVSGHTATIEKLFGP